MSSLDKKISQLTATTALNPGDYFAVVQNGETKKVDFANLFNNQSANLADIQTAISNGALVAGSLYYLTDVQTTQAETIPAKVLVQACANNALNPQALRIQLVPDYSALNIWDSAGTYSIGDKVIWGSRVWENLNGNVGTAPDYITLDTEWDEVQYVAGADYSELAMLCEYDIVNDVIYKQHYNGLVVETNLQTIQDFGLSGCDYCDWGQLKNIQYCTGNKFYGIGLLNNPNLNVLFNVNSTGVVNNACIEISNVQASAARVTQTSAGEVTIKDNLCDTISNITNIEQIQNIPSSVTYYSWVTDDETGYIEFDFDDLAYNAGTYVVGCILPVDVAIAEVTMNGDGGLPGGITFTFGIDTDDPTHVAFTSGNINSAPQRDTTISARTSVAARPLKLAISGGNATAGKLWITYKYI